MIARVCEQRGQVRKPAEQRRQQNNLGTELSAPNDIEMVTTQHDSVERSRPVGNPVELLQAVVQVRGHEVAHRQKLLAMNTLDAGTKTRLTGSPSTWRRPPQPVERPPQPVERRTTAEPTHAAHSFVSHKWRDVVRVRVDVVDTDHLGMNLGFFTNVTGSSGSITRRARRANLGEQFVLKVSILRTFRADHDRLARPRITP